MTFKRKQYVSALVLFVYMELQCSGEVISYRRQKYNVGVNKGSQNNYNQSTEVTTNLPVNSHIFSAEDYDELQRAQSLHHALSIISYDPQKIDANETKKEVSTHNKLSEKTTQYPSTNTAVPFRKQFEILGSESRKITVESQKNEKEQFNNTAPMIAISKTRTSIRRTSTTTTSSSLPRYLTTTTTTTTTTTPQLLTLQGNEELIPPKVTSLPSTDQPPDRRHVFSRRSKIDRPTNEPTVIVNSTKETTLRRGRKKIQKASEESVNQPRPPPPISSLVESDKTTPRPFLPTSTYSNIEDVDFLPAEQQTFHHRTSSIKQEEEGSNVTPTGPRRIAASHNENDISARTNRVKSRHSKQDQTPAQSIIPETVPYSSFALKKDRTYLGGNVGQGVIPYRRQSYVSSSSEKNLEQPVIPRRRIPMIVTPRVTTPYEEVSYSTVSYPPGRIAERPVNPSKWDETHSLNLNNPKGQERQVLVGSENFQQHRHPHNYETSTARQRKSRQRKTSTEHTSSLQLQDNNDIPISQKLVRYNKQQPVTLSSPASGDGRIQINKDVLSSSVRNNNYLLDKVQPNSKLRKRITKFDSSSSSSSSQEDSESNNYDNSGDNQSYYKGINRNRQPMRSKNNKIHTYKVTEDTSENSDDKSSRQRNSRPSIRQGKVYREQEPQYADSRTVEQNSDQSVGQNNVGQPDFVEVEDQDLIEEADHQRKEHKEPEHNEEEEGGSQEHHEGDHEEEGDQGDKNYKEYHEHEKGEKGHHDKESHDYEYDEKDGGDKKHSDEAGYSEEKEKGEKGEKKSGFTEKGKHSEGHNTKGEHVIHKKDEFEKKTEFYDEFHDSGEVEKEAGHLQEHKHGEGGHYKKGHKHEDREEEEHGLKKKYEKGLHKHDKKGHKEHEGHEHRHHHEERHGKKGGHEDAKKWSHKKGGR